MFNLLSEINSDTLAISLVIIILFTLITAVLAFVAVFLIGKYHSVDDEDTLKVGKLKIGYMIPTFILFRKGQQLWRQSGELPLERLERAVKGFKS